MLLKNNRGEKYYGFNSIWNLTLGSQYIAWPTGKIKMQEWKKTYPVDFVGVDEAITVGKQEGQEYIENNGVNSGKLHHLMDNPEPSRVNGMKVARKVQRLTGEQPSNKPDTSAPPEREEIV